MTLQRASADQHNEAPSHVDPRQRIKIAIVGTTAGVLKGTARRPLNGHRGLHLTRVTPATTQLGGMRHPAIAG
jgi:hypothetical protein